MRNKLVCALLTLAAVIAAAATPVLASNPSQSGQPVTIYFFWGDGCPHCAAAEPFLADLAGRYPSVTIRDYEVWYHEENREPLIKMAAKFGFEPSGVPTIFVGDRYWVGFGEDTIGAEIEATVAACIQLGCPDAGSGVITPAATAAPTPVAMPTAEVAVVGSPPGETTTAASQPSGGAAAGSLSLPFLGSVDLATQSLALSTALIAFVDGFNPCSLWVLGILLALTLHTGSRKKVFIIGLVFLTVTSLVYALFIAGLFTMFTIVSFAPWIRIVIALVALFFAAVNIKDYFWYKAGISFTIADEKKPGLYKSMRRVLSAGDSMPALIGATIVMSAGASLVEFSCTAGFPVLWTNLLAAQGVTALTFAALLGLYMVIYQLDEIAIFMAAVVSLRASKLEEKQGRILKLVGGMLMLTLAVVMLVNPNLMNRVTTSLLVFAVAFAAAGLVLLVHRVILPRFGVTIGTEFAPRGD
jgi:thiol-disulfide isomerase/thioredoxin